MQKNEEEPSLPSQARHPLEYSWWFYLHTKNERDWDKQMSKLLCVNTVEDFWAVHDRIPRASNIGNDTGYFFFRDGIQPAWEDRRNAGGFVISYLIEKRVSDIIWTEVLVLLVGGRAFGSRQAHVNGTSINVRSKKDKLEVWCAAPVGEQGAEEIRKIIADRLIELLADNDFAMPEKWISDTRTSRIKPQ